MKCVWHFGLFINPTNTKKHENSTASEFQSFNAFFFFYNIRISEPITSFITKKKIVFLPRRKQNINGYFFNRLQYYDPRRISPSHMKNE